MKQTELFEIRERRQRGWFWIDNEFIDKYAPVLGLAVTGVYVCLCRHTDTDTQRCHPSIALLARELGMSTRTVIRALQLLERHKFISIVREKDPMTKRWKANVYTLLDKTEWVLKPDDTQSHGAVCQKPGDTDDKSQVTPGTQKETNKIINKTKREGEVQSEPLPCSISKPEFIKQTIGLFMAAFETEYSKNGKKVVYRVVRGKDHKLLSDEYDRLTKLGFIDPLVEVKDKLAIAFAWDRTRYPGRPKTIGQFLVRWNDYLVEVTDEERAKVASQERTKRQMDEQVLSLAKDFIFRNENQKLTWDAWTILRNFDRPRYQSLVKAVKAKVEELKTGGG